MFRLLVSKFNSKMITADIDAVRHNMIYVDFDKRDAESAYLAFNKGASLIMTQHNIDDLRVPAITVEDVGSSYLELLDISHGHQLEKANFIPIYGGNHANIISKILEHAFKRVSLEANKILPFSDLPVSLNSPSKSIYIEDFFYYVLNRIMSGIDIIPMVYDEESFFLREFMKSKSECEILSRCVFKTFKNAYRNDFQKVLLINIDDPCALSRIHGNNEDVIITYGLNKKAAVTATSIDYGEYTNFNYCLQRSFISRSSERIEPFETPLAIKGLGLDRIYAALASVSCALYYDIDLKIIKEALIDYGHNGRDFLVRKYEKFTLVDNYCSTEADYKETFEMLQYIDYESLYVVVSCGPVEKDFEEEIIIRIINEFVLTLNIKEVICVYSSEKMSMAYNGAYNLYGIKNFPDDRQNLKMKYFYQLPRALKYTINKISKGDVLLTIGGREMDLATTIIELML